MSSDASIYGLLKPANPLPDPLEQYGKFQNLQALMGQNKLQGLQTQKLGSDIQEEQDFKSGLAGLGPTGLDDAGVTRLMAISPTRGIQLQKTLLENKRVQSDLDKNAVEIPLKKQELVTKLTAQHRDDLANVNDPQAAAQWLQAGYEHPVLGPVLTKLSPLQDAIGRIPQDPAQFQQWKQQQALGATKFIELNKPQVHERRLGDKTETLSTPGLGGAPTVIASAPIAQSPDSVASNATTIRGQNMTDARARELNGIMEGRGPQDVSGVAKMIANHDLPMPNPPSQARNPMAMVRYGELVKAVQAENPTYNAQDYVASQKARNAFASGPLGAQVQAANTAVNHLGTLEELGLALKNGNIQLFNKIANRIGAETGQSAPTNLQAAVTMVAPEISKAVVGAAGGVEDRANAAKALNAAAASPQQLLGVVATQKKLLAGRLTEAERRYQADTFRRDFREKYLSPAVRDILAKEAPDAATADLHAKADAILNGK